jgi:hypothetical protein
MSGRWIALARTLDDTASGPDAAAALRAGIDALPDSGRLRWRLRSLNRERIDESDLGLLRVRILSCLFAGKGALLGQLGRDGAGPPGLRPRAELHERRVSLTRTARRRTSARPGVRRAGRESGYAELVTALLLDPLDADTVTRSVSCTSRQAALLGPLPPGAGARARFRATARR